MSTVRGGRLISLASHPYHSEPMLTTVHLMRNCVHPNNSLCAGITLLLLLHYPSAIQFEDLFFELS
jgi:hypothetical protein